MTHIGKWLCARGKRPKVKYQHRVQNTYLYGAFSPINGHSFVWEINGVDKEIFFMYLNALSKHKPLEYKIVVIDNAGFHSTKDMKIPHNIFLLNIPPYSPELNPCERIWQQLKHRFKNLTFKDLKSLRKWLHQNINNITPEQIMSITHDPKYVNELNAALYV